jgi:hypothetical protein
VLVKSFGNVNVIVENYLLQAEQACVAIILNRAGVTGTNLPLRHMANPMADKTKDHESIEAG